MTEHDATGLPPEGVSPPTASLEHATVVPGRREVFLALAILVVLVSGVFGPTLRFGFVYDDDWTILNNPLLSRSAIANGATWSGIVDGELARQGLPDAGRPTMIVSEMLDVLLFRGTSFGFHLQNLLLHGAVSALFFLALLRFGRRRLGPSFGASFLAAAWFAVSPILVEPVAAINYREDLLVALFSLLGIGAFFAARSAQGRGRLGFRAGGMVALGLGALAKESGYVAPLLLVLLDVWPELALRAQARRLGRDWLLAASPIVATFIWRSVVMGRIGIVSRTAEIAEPGLAGRWLAGAWGFAASATKAVVPVGLSPEYASRNFSDFTGVLLASVMVSGLLAGLAVTVLLRKRAPDITLAAAFAFVAYLPTIGLVPIGNPQADRYFYLSAMGLLAGLAFALGRGLERLCKSGRPGARKFFERFTRGRAVWLAGALLVAAFGLRARAQTRIWSNELALWEAAILKAPASPRAWAGRASALLGANRTVEAVDAASTSVELGDGYSGYAVLGLSWMRQGNLSLACGALEHARDRAGPAVHTEAVNNLGYCYRRAGRYPEALVLFREARKRSPWFDRPWLNEATALSAMGQFAEAKAILRAYLDRNPASSEARYLLRRIDATEKLSH